MDAASIPSWKLKMIKVMYWMNVVVAGFAGVLILFVPGKAKEIFEVASDADPLLFGFQGAVPLAFCLVSIIALKYPLRFVPVLFLQLIYKGLYLILVHGVLLVQGNYPENGITELVIFVVFIIGNAVAIPFKQLFAAARTAVPAQQ